MKAIPVLLLALLLGNACMAQSPKISWGDEFKMSKGSTDLSVVITDNTGVYLQESHRVLKSYFVIGATTRESATLVKLDKNLTEQYRNTFNKELRGKEFEQFFSIGDKIYITASNYNRREKTLTLHAAEIDKNTGELASDWMQVANWQKEEKRDEINFRMSGNEDNTSLFLVSSVQGREKNSYQVQEFDKNLKPLGAPTNISNEFDPQTFQLEDVLYTSSKRIVLVGRVYEYEEGKRKRARFLNFTHYNIRIYDSKGKQQTDINTDINSKWLVSTKVLQEKDKDLVIAAFYSDSKRGAINGLLVQRIDPLTGNVLTTSQKEINTSLIAPVEDDVTAADDGDESKQERKEREKFEKIKDESEGFTRYMQFRNVFYTPDGGLVILAERYHHYSYETQSYTPGINGAPGSYSTQYYTVFESGDLMMCKVDAGGNIGWLQVLPKAQREVVSGSYSNYSGGFSIGNYYFNTSNMPFYSGFGALQNGDKINIMFNDNPRNEGLLQLGQKVRTATAFRRSNCFNLVLDVKTGKYTRKLFFSNKETPTAMPRLGSYIGDDMYIVGREDRLFGKTKVAVARITVPN
jgi:hypothetical protein